MATNNAPESVEAAKRVLREKWQETGDTDAKSCPSCDAKEVEWDVEDAQVEVRCRHCGYVDSQRYTG